MKTIGNKIKELRRSKGMSQKDIADKLGVTSQAVSKWENDGSLPEMTMLPDCRILRPYSGFRLMICLNTLPKNVTRVLKRNCNMEES